MKTTIVLLAAGIALYGCSQNKASEKHTPAAAAAGSVYKLAAITKAGLMQTVKLPAQLAAYEEVSIFPKVNGYVKKVLVDIGEPVHRGQLLMTLEAPELLQQTMQAKEKYARSKSDFTLDKENYQRLLQAAETPGAVSPMDLSTAHSKMEADSSLSNAESANWQLQQTMLGYLQVQAPFDGVITERNVHTGALVSAAAKDKPMLELKQINHLRLQVDIPEGIAANLNKGQDVVFYLSAFPGKKMTAQVSRIAQNVNLQYRTERVELDVQNTAGKLTPGMYADIVLDAKGNPNAMSVPKSAVVTSTERKYVIVVRAGQTVKVDVATGNETAAAVEVLGDLKPGEQVIVNAKTI
ncbi:efflux RND transporter periplasmic adaptor subunit [Deminuibacter soli]|nr:efflux RND transporter periplasmic adaptor subunit [Deminuibacter soli]